MDFQSFMEIENVSKILFSITQKLHGSNAQIYVYQSGGGNLDLMCGSRTRWVTPEDDNYGFAAFVHKHKDEFIQRLGEGRHYGEWIGPGIGSGEGLKEKTFALFAWWRFKGAALPPRTVTVPVLYDGPVDIAQIDVCMDRLRAEGSQLVPGFMKPEGIVVQINDLRYKKVFQAEEAKWKTKDKAKAPPKEVADYSHLCQPVRLEKLIARDSRYMEGYPKSLPLIVKDYVADLVKEKQISGSEEEIETVRKRASGQIFKFVKAVVDELPPARS